MRRFVTIMVGWGPVAAAPAAETSARDAAARLTAAQSAALAQAPGLRAARAGVAVEAAGHRREAASGSPYVEWQSEGLGGSGRQPNGADYLRVGTPFNLPGQIGRARSLVRSADAWVDDAVAEANIATAAATARRWLALATARERE